MRDIPMFTTEYGVASLILKEIPYCKDAYVLILDSSAVEQFVEECADFCRMAGARNIYLAGADVPVKYPLFTEIWQMQCPVNQLQKSDAELMPVNESNAGRWREIYNARMANIPAAAFMSGIRVEQLLKSGSCYFAYRNKKILGIVAISGQNIVCIASVLPGAGKDILCALTNIVSGEMLHLEVASENKRAVSFYEKLGFKKTAVKEIWYQYVP